MASITYSTGTVISSGWLNDVNTVAYAYFGNGANLNSPAKLNIAIVETPLVQGSAGIIVNAIAGDINFQTAGTRRWNILNSTSSLQPDQDNVFDFGDTTHRPRVGYFGTNVVTPSVQSMTDVPLDFGIAGVSKWRLQPSGANGFAWLPFTDNSQQIGSTANRISTGYFGTSVVTPLIVAAGALEINSGSSVFRANNSTTSLGDATHPWTSGYFGTSVVSPVLNLITTTTGNNLASTTTSAAAALFGTFVTDSGGTPKTYLFGSDPGSGGFTFSGSFSNHPHEIRVNNVAAIRFTGVGAVRSPTGSDLTLGTTDLGTLWSVRNSDGRLLPSTDNTIGIGGTSNRVSFVTTPIIDSGSTGSLSLRTNNGTLGLEIINQTSAVNYMQVRPEASGTDPSFIANGNDANVGFRWITKGTGGYAFHTNGSGTNTQARILHVANAVNYIRLQGSATGASPAIFGLGSDTNVKLVLGSQGSGSLDLYTDSLGSSPLQFQVLHTASATSNATITGAAAAGIFGATLNTTDSRIFKITPGLVWGTGTTNFGTATKRKSTDESVTSSTTLQNDDELVLGIAANEQWSVSFFLDIGAVLNSTGVKIAITVPSGATLNTCAKLNAADSSPGTFGRTSTSGSTIIDITAPNLASSTNGFIIVHAWVANSTTPGNIQLQWAQSSSNATALTFRTGSVMNAVRVS